jgi:PAS domain S-box-containing protein
MFDYSKQELLGASSLILYVNEEEFIRAGEEIYGQIEQNGIGIGESRLRSKNGEVKDVLLCLSPLDASDLSKGITITVLDITARKQAEAALRESEKKYRSVIENVQDVFYRTDFNGRLLMSSPSGAKMFGYGSVDEMIGISLSTLWVDPSNRHKLISMISETNHVKDFEAHLKRKDGSTFYASFTTISFMMITVIDWVPRDNPRYHRAKKDSGRDPPIERRPGSASERTNFAIRNSHSRAGSL